MEVSGQLWYRGPSTNYTIAPNFYELGAIELLFQYLFSVKLHKILPLR